MRLASSTASLIAATLLVPACQLYFTDDDDDDPCLYPPAYSSPAPQRLLNPETLACETFTQPYPCDSQCGPCPLAGAIYIPPWGDCNSPCVGLDEDSCMANTQCRVARSYSDYYSPWTGADDYMGCYPLNTGPVPDVQRCEGLDAEQCAWQSDCTALYDGAPGQCNGLAPEACIGAQFRQCIPAALTDPGECTPAACRVVEPDCPSGTTPGVSNSCYTGACIPTEFCEVIAF